MATPSSLCRRIEALEARLNAVPDRTCPECVAAALAPQPIDYRQAAAALRPLPPPGGGDPLLTVLPTDEAPAPPAPAACPACGRQRRPAPAVQVVALDVLPPWWRSAPAAPDPDPHRSPIR